MSSDPSVPEDFYRTIKPAAPIFQETSAIHCDNGQNRRPSDSSIAGYRVPATSHNARPGRLERPPRTNERAENYLSSANKGHQAGRRPSDIPILSKSPSRSSTRGIVARTSARFESNDEKEPPVQVRYGGVAAQSQTVQRTRNGGEDTTSIEKHVNGARSQPRRPSQPNGSLSSRLLPAKTSPPLGERNLLFGEVGEMRSGRSVIGHGIDKQFPRRHEEFSPPDRRGKESVSPDRLASENGLVQVAVSVSPKKESPQLRRSRDRDALTASTFSSRNRAAANNHLMTTRTNVPAIGRTPTREQHGTFVVDQARVRDRTLQKLEEASYQANVMDPSLNGRDDNASSHFHFDLKSGEAPAEIAANYSLHEGVDAGEDRPKSASTTTHGMPGDFPETPNPQDELCKTLRLSNCSSETSIDGQSISLDHSDSGITQEHDIMSDPFGFNPFEEDSFLVDQHAHTTLASIVPTTAPLQASMDMDKPTPEALHTSTIPALRNEDVDRGFEHSPTDDDCESIDSEIITSMIGPTSSLGQDLPDEVNHAQEQSVPFQLSETSRVDDPSNFVLNGSRDLAESPTTDIESDSSDEIRLSSKNEFRTSPDVTHETFGLESRYSRTSRNSTWTDDSVQSNGIELVADSVMGRPRYSGLEQRPTPPPKLPVILTKPAVPPKTYSHSPQTSPSAFYGTPPFRSFSSFPLQGEALPSRRNSSQLVAKESPLPPVPTTSGNENSRYNFLPKSSSGDIYGADDDIITEQPRASSKDPSSKQQLDVERQEKNSPTLVEPVQETIDHSSIVSREFSDSRVGCGPSYSEELARIPQTPLPSEEQARLKRRRHIIFELINTEASHLKDMSVMEEIYKGTAEVCPRMGPLDIEVIFRNITDIVAISAAILEDMKAACKDIYTTRSSRRRSTISPVASTDAHISQVAFDQSYADKDHKTRIGAVIYERRKEISNIYSEFIQSTNAADSRLNELKMDPAVQVWLTECNTVAKDLTAAWNLEALMIKPFQRLCKLPMILGELYGKTSSNHPDRPFIFQAKVFFESCLANLNSKVSPIDSDIKIMTRKRKDSEPRKPGFAKLLGGRKEKLQAYAGREFDDKDFIRCHDKFGEEYVRLQVVLRDVEFYTRQVASYVGDFLQYLSAMELFVRFDKSSALEHQHLRSKWTQFNTSMRDMQTVGLVDHVNTIKTHVIGPIEQIIRLYEAPLQTMSKRTKRRADHEKYLAVKQNGKKADEKLEKLEEEYHVLNAQLKKELPKLSTLTSELGRICLQRFLRIMTDWYEIWQVKLQTVLEKHDIPKDIADVVTKYTQDSRFFVERLQALQIVDHNARDRTVSSSKDDKSSGRSRSSLSVAATRVNSSTDEMPAIPTPDLSNGFGLSTGDGHYDRMTKSDSQGSLTLQSQSRPSTGRSRFSERYSQASEEVPSASRSRSRHHDYYTRTDSLSRPSSGLFNSAMPPEDAITGFNSLSITVGNDSRRSSQASYLNPQRHARQESLGDSSRTLSPGISSTRRASQPRQAPIGPNHNFDVLYIAASLYKFVLEETKIEAGYPYLMYEAGEIFDVIAEKGELWLAVNQDDGDAEVGWIWSKHFMRLPTI